MKRVKWFIVIFWYGLGLYLSFCYVQSTLYPALYHAKDFSTWLNFGKSIISLLLLGGSFGLVHITVRAALTNLQLQKIGDESAVKGLIQALKDEDKGVQSKAEEALIKIGRQESRDAFPSNITVIVGFLLIIYVFLFVMGLFLSLDPKMLPEWLRFRFTVSKQSVIQDPLITMFAAGVGSMITTIMGYLRHACEEKDFEYSYAPWYIARPLMGLLLGLIFYFVLKGGILVTVPEIKDMEFNEWGLAGLGALVGLFSRNAIEKLREVFYTLFSSKEERTRELLDRLPKDLKEKVGPYLITYKTKNSKKTN